VLAGLALVVAEIGLRGFVYFVREPFERFDLASGTFDLVPGQYPDAYGGRIVVNEAGFAGRPLRQRAAVEWRVVAVGNSCTFGGGDGVHTFPDLLAERLRARRRGATDYEVINAGISGLDTQQVTRRTRSRVADLEPDVVVIYTGWNDLMKKSPIGQIGDGASAGVAAWLDDLWLVRGLRKVVFQRLRPIWADPATGPASRTGRFRYFEPRRYRDDLVELVRATRNMGAAPLLVTLPSPLRADLTPAQLAAARITFPSVAGTYRVGDFVDLIAAYNRVIRDVARQHDVALLDLADDFAAIPEAPRYFHDTMHPNDAGMALIAHRLEASLARHGLLAEPVPKSTATEAPRADRAPDPGTLGGRPECVASQAC